jgi:hypothetical protein
MSIIQQVSNATLNDNWRTINIDALDPESSSNFETSTLHPAFAPVSQNEIATLGQQVRQLLRGGDAEGALRGALEGAPYGGDAAVKVRGALLIWGLEGEPRGRTKRRMGGLRKMVRERGYMGRDVGKDANDGCSNRICISRP